MIDLRGYNIHEQIYKTDIMEIYRGYSINDKKPVIIKAINGEAPISTDVSKIMHEYGITRNLNIDGIIKPFKLEQSEQGLALITEDIQAESLRKYILNNT